MAYTSGAIDLIPGCLAYMFHLQLPEHWTYDRWRRNLEAVIIVDNLSVTVLRWERLEVRRRRTDRGQSRRRRGRPDSRRWRTPKTTPRMSPCYRVRTTYLWYRNWSRWTRAPSECLTYPVTKCERASLIMSELTNSISYFANMSNDTKPRFFKRSYGYCETETSTFFVKYFYS